MRFLAECGKPPSPMTGPQSGEHLAYGSGDRRGCLEVICGSMFSGKTEELIRRIRRAKYARQVVQVFKPRVDNRYDAVKVVSHEGINTEAVPVATTTELLSLVRWDDTAIVGVDEIQFFDASIVDACQTLANRGLRVICAGLDQDYLGQPFGPMPQLMAVAEYVTKLHAVCARCGGEASYSQRLIAQEGQLFVGAPPHTKRAVVGVSLLAQLKFRSDYGRGFLLVLDSRNEGIVTPFCPSSA